MSCRNSRIQRLCQNLRIHPFLLGHLIKRFVESLVALGFIPDRRGGQAESATCSAGLQNQHWRWLCVLYGSKNREV